MRRGEQCDHLLDDSNVPGYAFVCLNCGYLWKYGPRTGAYRWAPVSGPERAPRDWTDQAVDGQMPLPLEGDDSIVRLS